MVMIDSDEVSFSDSSENSEAESYCSNQPYIDLTSCIYPLKQYKSKSKYITGTGQYQFPCGKDVKELPRLPPENSYWHFFNQRIGYYKYTKEKVSLLIDKKINKIVDYFSRLELNKLTKKELNKKMPTNFFGPYFPTVKELQIFVSLHIYINWEDTTTNTKFGNGNFTVREIECLLDRWKQFQQEYKIFDLRPLLGVRCGYFNKEKNEFIFFKCINHEENRNFLKWMRRAVPSKSVHSIEKKLKAACDWFIEGQFKIEKISLPISGLEVHCMEEINERFGFGSNKTMELLIGKRQKLNYLNFHTQYLAIKHIPIKHGHWNKVEDLKLITNIYENFNIECVEELLKTNKPIPVFNIFNDIKVRSINMIHNRWVGLKKNLAVAKDQEDIPADKRTGFLWTQKDNVKLIKEVYKSNANTLGEVDWCEISKKFKGTCDYTVMSKFYFIYKSRVPNSKKKYFDEAMEYLYHRVNPVYKLKLYRERRVNKDINYLLDLCSSSEVAASVGSLFDTEELVDYEEDFTIIKETLCDSSFSERGIPDNPSIVEAAQENISAQNQVSKQNDQSRIIKKHKVRIDSPNKKSTCSLDSSPKKSPFSNEYLLTAKRETETERSLHNRKDNHSHKLNKKRKITYSEDLTEIVEINKSKTKGSLETNDSEDECVIIGESSRYSLEKKKKKHKHKKRKHSHYDC